MAKAKKKPAAKKPAAKKPAAKKPAAKKPAAEKPAAEKPAPRKKMIARRAPASVDTLSPTELLGRIALEARADAEPGDELPILLARLQDVATAALVPAMLGVLEDDDPHGVLWSVFYLLEGFDDDYLAGLIAALPALHERAPGWTDTALLRIVNTRGEPEDCTGAFVALAKRRRASERKEVVAILRALERGDEPLAPVQRKAITEMAAAIAK